MVRLARIVLPEIPHHVVQRGNRRQNVFFKEEDKAEYLKILGEQGKRFGLKFWAYCLMSNHVHLIAVPEFEYSLARGIGEAHRRYTRLVNFREGWRGYLWQGRFHSFPLDERYLFAAVRYVERNPVRAKIVSRAEDYPWSSAKAHVHKITDPLISECYLTGLINNWSEYLALKDNEEEIKVIRRHGSTGRPAGARVFIESIEAKFGIIVTKQKPGPKRRN